VKPLLVLVGAFTAAYLSGCGPDEKQAQPSHGVSPVGRDFSDRCEDQPTSSPTTSPLKPTTKPLDDRQVPFHAVAKITLRDGSICSSVLIARSTLVTAAHCLAGENPPMSAEFFLQERSIFVSLRESKMSMHPTFASAAQKQRSLSTHPELASFDIGLINLPREISEIEPVALAQNLDLPSGKLVGVIGFGDTGHSNGVRRFAYSHVGAVIRSETIGSTEFSDILALNSQSGTGACPGDSGGGVFIKNGRNWELASLISGVNDVVYPLFPVLSCNRCPNGIGLGPLAFARLAQKSDGGAIGFH